MFWGIAMTASRSVDAVAEAYSSGVSLIIRKSSRFPVWSMTPRPGHRCAITRRCNDERRDPLAPV